MTCTRALAALALLLPAPAFAKDAAPDAFLPDTAPAELAPGEKDTRVGELIFRGGVEIAPDKADIGGISSLEWHEGALVAVTDDGRWMELTIDEIGGKLVDVSGVRLGPLRDAQGKALDAKVRGDAEALTRLPSGEWLVAFEQDHRVWRFADLEGNANGTNTRAASLTAGAAPNEGIETLAAYPGGVLACSEWADPARPNCLRIADAGAATPFHLAAPEGIAAAGGVPTDAACKADGTCYVLFRSYNAKEGNRAAVVALAPDNTAITLGVLAPPLALDNFEGIAVREEPGRTFLYLASDDNLNNCGVKPGPRCQRNLLYKFEIAPPPGVAPAPIAPAAFAVAPTGRPGVRPHPEAASVSVVLETSLGPVTIALETERAPVTAGNFLKYVDGKRLDGTTFYRAMALGGERQPAGIVQGGTANDPKRELPKIAHEPTGKTGLTHSHGAVSMAMNFPGDADGDFFVIVEDQPGFDADPSSGDPALAAGYAVFGYVTSGMDVVAAILASPRDPNAGDGVMKGQILAEPVKILSARRVQP
ncbi:esterase-like activity of phytase family protein [Erythrobacter sp. NE805]|uniref:esterase-like activity of phytase family protein n=1 Tax=Erythrobacter sp. NE805 TaxID=3389875 RepID=UPI00396AF14D